MSYILDDSTHPYPSLDIQQAVPDVVPPPFAGGDALLIHPQAFDSDELFVGGQEACLHWRIWKPNEHHDRECHSEAAAEQEDDLIRVQYPGLDMSQTIT